jgi:hypothetical protein
VRAPRSPSGVHHLRPLVLLLGVAALASCQRAAPPRQGEDPHARVRPVIQADTAIQALRPPAEAYVWYQATPDGHVVASGRDTSRVALIQHAHARGKVTLEGFAPPGVLAPVRVFYEWIEVPGKP